MAAGVILFPIIMQLAISSVSLSVDGLAVASFEEDGNKRLPIVISTWAFVDAVRAAWEVVEGGGSPIDAVVAGCSTCERLRCDGSGAVGALRSVRDAIGAARLVMDHTEHTLLVGDQASAFALSLGLSGPANLSTDDSLDLWSTWRDKKCQPNFWQNVIPDPRFSCGPYHTWRQSSRHSRMVQECGERTAARGSSQKGIGPANHDTISMAVIDKSAKIAVGTSTNGATYKIPGRVGDGPIVGASGYADDEVGACGATGDGDIMMRFLPCYQVVESMRLGRSPEQAAEDAIARIKRKFPLFVGALFAIDRHGVHAGACNGWTFQYAVQGHGMEDVEIYTVRPQS